MVNIGGVLFQQTVMNHETPSAGVDSGGGGGPIVNKICKLTEALSKSSIKTTD